VSDDIDERRIIKFGHDNAWANGRLYAATAPLGDHQIPADTVAEANSSSNWRPALAPWFNLQTRALLTGLTGEAPEFDRLFFQRLIVHRPRLAIVQ
jgi:hypothetical protein